MKEDHEKRNVFQRELHFERLRSEPTPWHRELFIYYFSHRGGGGRGSKRGSEIV